jgi:hypothetical protein
LGHKIRVEESLISPNFLFLQKKKRVTEESQPQVFIPKYLSPALTQVERRKTSAIQSGRAWHVPSLNWFLK